MCHPHMERPHKEHADQSVSIVISVSTIHQIPTLYQLRINYGATKVQPYANPMPTKVQPYELHPKATIHKHCTDVACYVSFPRHLIHKLACYLSFPTFHNISYRCLPKPTNTYQNIRFHTNTYQNLPIRTLNLFSTINSLNFKSSVKHRPGNFKTNTPFEHQKRCYT